MTVKQLIEKLLELPEDFIVTSDSLDVSGWEVEYIDINENDKEILLS